MLFSCSGEPALTLRGETMGTFYMVKVCGAEEDHEKARVRMAVNAALTSVNRSMNTYDPQSEISQFNAYREKGAFPLSPDFIYVTEIADSIYGVSRGAFDPTVGALVDMWGFGESRISEMPDSAAVSRNLQHVGMDKIRILKNGILKKDPELHLDYASLAKGYGVDAVLRGIRELGYNDLLVEIGGEVRAGGSCNGRPWMVGVAVPEAGNVANRRYSLRIGLEDMACASSGDYQQFYELKGKRYSHLIDPKTGYPIEHELTSVSVIAESCVVADALATAAIVLGKHKGIEMIESLEGVEAHFIYRDRRGGLQTVVSSGWTKYQK
ncbi:MAG: FAD:protein FMN transferase [Candidatus Marinimicrobia bacterium]|nr:FAD:protein FMN transferase [Candidatus Neomarinimicrobiota bacterium]